VLLMKASEYTKDISSSPPFSRETNTESPIAFALSGLCGYSDPGARAARWVLPGNISAYQSLHEVRSTAIMEALDWWRGLLRGARWKPTRGAASVSGSRVGRALRRGSRCAARGAGALAGCAPRPRSRTGSVGWLGAPAGNSSGEFEPIQSHMAPKPMQRGKVGARALRVQSVSREGAWASAGAQGAWVSGCGCGCKID